MTWGVIYVLLWAYRAGYSVLSQVLINRLTSIGDSGRYQDAIIERPLGEAMTEAVYNPREAATVGTEAIGALFNAITGGNVILTHIGFQSIAYVGILTLLRATPPSTRRLLLLFLLMPSFTLWSSVAGKEALVVFAVGVLSAFAINLYQGRARIGLLVPPALIVVLLTKNQYMPAIIFLIVGTYAARSVRQHASIVLWGGILSLGILYLLREQLGEMAMGIAPHFSGLGSSRPPFWEAPGDFFAKAPLGMWLAFFGPTVSEALSGPLQLVTFIESSLLVVALLAVLLTRLPRMPVYTLIMGGFTLFWILLATYPTGAMNAGSAIRYRTGYQLLVLALIIVLMSRDNYIQWRGTLHERFRAIRPRSAQIQVTSAVDQTPAS